MKPHAWNNHRYYEIHFLTKDSKWEHLQESCAIATYKADEFKQSPLKPVSAFRESKTSKWIQGIELFISIASLQEKQQQQKKPPGPFVILFMLLIHTFSLFFIDVLVKISFGISLK